MILSLTKFRILALFAIAGCLVSSNSGAQEDLDTIAERGSPLIWYVCGPFESDLPEGILSAVQRGEKPLGRFDFFGTQGGTKRFRPSNGLQVTTASGTSTWLRTRSTEEQIDLGPFFANQDSGIAFASFIVNTPAPAQVLLEVQSQLGVRLFLNGNELQDISAGSVNSIGVDRVVGNLGRGENVFLIEVPGISLHTLTKTLGAKPSELFRNRDRLTPETGYEIAVSVQEVTTFDPIVYAPRLTISGVFSGSAKNLFQEVWLTLFNPTTEPTPPLIYRGMSPGASTRIESNIPPIAPGSLHRERLSIPVGSGIPGRSIRIQSSLNHETDSVGWESSIVTLAEPVDADIFFVSLPEHSPKQLPSDAERVQHRIDSIRTKLTAAISNPDYGFSLGTADEWFPALTSSPTMRAGLLELKKSNRIAAHNTYTNLDHRLANGELLIRNLQYGTALAESWLDMSQQSYWGWGSPSLAPQLPQILTDLRVPGVVHNINNPGQASLYAQLGPDGSTILHRRKVNTPALRSLLDVHHTAAAQHRSWQQKHIDTDLLVYENHDNSPETFWSKLSLPLMNAIPSVNINGSGADRYFETLYQDTNFIEQPVPLDSRPIESNDEYDVLTNPELASRRDQLQWDLLTAETMISLATRDGGEVPYADLDNAWRAVLELNRTDATTGKLSAERLVDRLSLMRETDVLINELTQIALRIRTTRIATQSELADRVSIDEALVVFNSTNWTRSDVVESIITPPEGNGILVLDEFGRIVPFEVVDYTVINQSLKRVVLRFVARDVPRLGHKTYYLRYTGGLPQSSEVFTPHIENDFYRISFEGGEISAINSKANPEGSRTDIAFNDLLAYKVTREDEALRWTGEVQRSSAKPSTLRLERFSLGQRAIIETPFLDGQLIRTVTLFDGVPRIEVDVELRDVNRSDFVLATEFKGIPMASSPILGKAFGNMVGARDRSAPIFDSTTGSTTLPDTNHSLRFHGAAHGAGLSAGDSAYLALGPTTLIHTASVGSIENAAKLQRALIHQGVSSAAFAYDDLDTKPVWRDDTLSDSFMDDASTQTFFSILIGGAAQNPATEALLSRLSETVRDHAESLLAEGKPVVVPDANVPFGRSPLPTLILGGETRAVTRKMVEVIVSQLKTGGTITLDKEQVLELKLPMPSQQSLAILHPGAALSQLQDDTLTHFLYTPSMQTDAELQAQPLLFNYAILPFTGRLRDSEIDHHSHSKLRPMISVQTDLHLGSVPPSASAVMLSPDDFIVTSLKPKRAPEAMMGEEARSLDALVLRGYETSGEASTVEVYLAFNAYGVATVDPLERERSEIKTVSGTIPLEIEPFDIHTTALYVTPLRHAAQDNAKTESTSPISSRGWTQNAGPVPFNEQKLVVRIADTLPTPDGKVEVTISNNSLSESYSGELIATVSENWTVLPDTSQYSLSPGAQTVVALNVSQESGTDSEWGMLVQTEQNGRVIYDTQSTKPFAFTATSARKNNEYLLTIKNPHGIPLLGRATLVSNHDLVQSPGPIAVTPLESNFHIPPYREKRILYTQNIDEDPEWLTVRISANDTTLYHPMALIEDTP